MADPRLASPPAPAAAPSAGPVAREAAQAQRRAAWTERRRRSFLRQASHELRTPLNAVIGFSEILAGELYGPMAEPRYRAHAELIRDSGQHLLKLVTQVLDIARLELGAMEMDLGPEPVAAAFAAARGAVAEAAAARGVVLPSHVAADAAWVRADGRALASVLAGLLRNAVAASPAGARVWMEAYPAFDGGVALEVRDEGPGMAPDQITRLLRPFEGGDGDLGRASGSGLGLPIAALTCAAMEGRLQLRPGLGGGLVASVRLQAAGPPGETPATAAP